MTKAQGWVLAALLLTSLIAAGANPGGLAQGYTNLITPGKAGITGSFIAYWIGALLILLLIADAAPVFASWIAGLILLGAILFKGPAAFKNWGVK